MAAEPVCPQRMRDAWTSRQTRGATHGPVRPADDMLPKEVSHDILEMGGKMLSSLSWAWTENGPTPGGQ